MFDAMKVGLNGSEIVASRVRLYSENGSLCNLAFCKMAGRR